MERISSVARNATTKNHSETSQQRLPDLRQLAVLMSQAKAYYPNQALPPETPDVYLKEWARIAARYGIDRFTNALWNRLRASDFFPLPQHIETECANIKAMATEQSNGTRMNIYRCQACSFQCAALQQPPACLECSGSLVLAARGTDPMGDNNRYFQAIRARPEAFISLPELEIEARQNIRRRRDAV